ncbi:hypothetical protein H2200_002137 [Cladophialophora chaetospira]|uniref:Uncharacterized protein n=1 Tax=Cladophialophora chaetospira TaxID=386627 RepID=A0AA39CLV3_9EURO|nr:hypothetical protein H2200_002137 [Cladophialophora chaetospira]
MVEGIQADEDRGRETQQDEDMVDVEASMSPSPSSTPETWTTPPSCKDAEDFTAAEWQTIALGWRDFQNDLRLAAQSGVRVWRMKVCVLTMAS